MVLGYSSVDRVEDDADQHEGEAEVTERGEDVATLPCDRDECSSENSRDDEVCKYMSCE